MFSGSQGSLSPWPQTRITSQTAYSTRTVPELLISELKGTRNSLDMIITSFIVYVGQRGIPRGVAFCNSPPIQILPSESVGRLSLVEGILEHPVNRDRTFVLDYLLKDIYILTSSLSPSLPPVLETEDLMSLENEQYAQEK